MKYLRFIVGLFLLPVFNYTEWRKAKWVYRKYTLKDLISWTLKEDQK